VAYYEVIIANQTSQTHMNYTANMTAPLYDTIVNLTIGRANTVTVVAHSPFEPTVPAINVSFTITTILTQIPLQAWVNSTDVISPYIALVNETVDLSYNITGGNNGVWFWPSVDFARTCAYVHNVDTPHCSVHTILCHLRVHKRVNRCEQGEHSRERHQSHDNDIHGRRHVQHTRVLQKRSTARRLQRLVGECMCAHTSSCSPNE
jgi:hypothetical protein